MSEEVRCVTCRHWKRDRSDTTRPTWLVGDAWRPCGAVNEFQHLRSAKAIAHGSGGYGNGADLYTAPDFGCIQWERLAEEAFADG